MSDESDMAPNSFAPRVLLDTCRDLGSAGGRGLRVGGPLLARVVRAHPWQAELVPIPEAAESHRQLWPWRGHRVLQNFDLN